MKEKLSELIKRSCQDLFNENIVPVINRPDEKFGDFSTNIALILSPKLNRSPIEISNELINKLNENKDIIDSVSLAGPGFINFKLNNNALLDSIKKGPVKEFQDKEVIVEFGNANPFKEMHLGHLYMSVVGDSIAKLFEASGAKVERVSYHGDVGLHVAKTIWAIKNKLNEDNNAKLEDIINDKKDIGEFYAYGTKAYETNEISQQEIKDINKLIYTKTDPLINEIYKLGKADSFSNFDEVFKSLEISFNKRYLESETSEAGVKIVNENIGKVFKHSDGAIVFDGESIGLHTRVFINSLGLPTYEAKDLGLAELKNIDFPNAVKSIIITDTQQLEYFKVMLAALKLINSDLANKTLHLTHGHLGLSTGKMSSRTGEIYTAKSFIQDIKQAVNSAFPDSNVKQEVYMSALRYTLLKHRLGSDIVIDVHDSVALEGNSGPYLQYSHARARSIFRRANVVETQIIDTDADFDMEERKLVSKISEFSDVVELAVNELKPHHVCNYLYELAQTFNRFYENSRVINDPRQDKRLSLILLYSNTLKYGLNMLGIPAPDKM